MRQAHFVADKHNRHAHTETRTQQWCCDENSNLNEGTIRLNLSDGLNPVFTLIARLATFVDGFYSKHKTICQQDDEF